VWRPRFRARAGLPVFISHGRTDSNLSFTATESFKDELVASGLDVSWCPFDGGHEIPLVALREFKKLLKRLPRLEGE
jgi:phospholipase/carboxylesterase